jgi:hypothetical protein
MIASPTTYNQKIILPRRPPFGKQPQRCNRETVATGDCSVVDSSTFCISWTITTEGVFFASSPSPSLSTFPIASAMRRDKTQSSHDPRISCLASRERKKKRIGLQGVWQEGLRSAKHVHAAVQIDGRIFWGLPSKVYMHCTSHHQKRESHLCMRGVVVII